MKIVFDSLHQEQREGRKGPYDVMVVKGVKTYDDSPYERTFFPNETELVETFNKFKTGDEIEIAFGSDRFRSITGASLLKSANKEALVPPEPQEQEQVAWKTPNAQVGGGMTMGTPHKETALKCATDLLVGMLKGGVGLKKTTSAELVATETVNVAEQFMTFLEGEPEVEIEIVVDKDNEVDEEEEVFPSDDEIPF